MSQDAYGSGSAPGFGISEALQGMPFAVGSVIARTYRVDRVIGAGGMGVVVAGTVVGHEGHRVAIKVMRPTAAETEEFLVRFSREARATAQLKSEHVARVLDVGAIDGNLPFMVMELLEGADLSRVLRQRGPLDVPTAVDFVLQACNALAEAHRIGIVHRDLKPANLFLCRREDGSSLVKVLDFGISKLSALGDDEGGDGLTKTQAMMGSPHYMSPEQLRSPRGVDARADIWSLGAVLFRLLTNETPFAAESTAELCVAILVGAPKMLRDVRPDVPPALEAVVMRCLAKAPGDRYASVAELAHALAPFVAGAPYDAMAMPRGATPAPNVAMSYLAGPANEATRAIPQSSAYAGYATQSTLTSSSSSLKPPVHRSPLSDPAKLALVVTGFLLVLGASVFAAVLAKSTNRPAAAVVAAPSAAPIPTSPPVVTATTTPAVATAAAIELAQARVDGGATTTPRPVAPPVTAAAPPPAPRPKPTTAPPPTPHATQAAAPKPTGDLPDFGGRK